MTSCRLLVSTRGFSPSTALVLAPRWTVRPAADVPQHRTASAFQQSSCRRTPGGELLCIKHLTKSNVISFVCFFSLNVRISRMAPANVQLHFCSTLSRDARICPSDLFTQIYRSSPLTNITVSIILEPHISTADWATKRKPTGWPERVLDVPVIAISTRSTSASFTKLRTEDYIIYTSRHSPGRSLAVVSLAVG